MQRVEDDLIKKEISLESKLKAESWGEEGEDHHVPMRPLVPHTPRHENGFRRHLEKIRDRVERSVGRLFHHHQEDEEHGWLSSMFHRSV